MNPCNYNYNIINLMVNRTSDKKIEESIDYVADPQYNNFVLVRNFTVGSKNSDIFFELIPSQKMYKPYTNFVVEKDENMNITRIIYGLYFRFENMRLEFGEGGI